MRFLFSAMLLCTLSLQCTFCGEETSASPPPYLKPVPPDALMAEPYDWELSRRAVPSVTDLVLIYGGGHHRTPYEWDRERLSDYVTYTDPDGRTQWLFDGFLLLEIMDPDGNGGSGVKFADGYTYDGRPSGAAERSGRPGTGRVRCLRRAGTRAFRSAPDSGFPAFSGNVRCIGRFRGKERHGKPVRGLFLPARNQHDYSL